MTATRVLVVEDHPLNRELAEAILERAGYDVVLAEDGETALETVAARRPDVILLDIDLPGISGLDVARQLKADPGTRAIPVVALTAYAMVGDEERVRAAGCDDYVTKPIERPKLLGAVERALAAPPGGAP
ncbi:MAG TPA: response regulator [Chloroflexota bacterium]|jgi:two-component system cell cycle response regulator DivK